MPTVTYEEINQARGDFQKARLEFCHKYRGFLTTVLKEAGVYKKLVRIKDKDLTGQFIISDDTCDRRPFEIKFFPVTLHGRISMKSKYLNNFHSWQEDTLVQQLKDIAEVVGDLP